MTASAVCEAVAAADCEGCGAPNAGEHATGRFCDPVCAAKATKLVWPDPASPVPATANNIQPWLPPLRPCPSHTQSNSRPATTTATASVNAALPSAPLLAAPVPLKPIASASVLLQGASMLPQSLIPAVASGAKDDGNPRLPALIAPVKVATVAASEKQLPASALPASAQAASATSVPQKQTPVPAGIKGVKATVASPRVCEGCAQIHDGSYGSGRFCSVHCARRIAASRKWEKQRSERKRVAAAAAAAAPSPSRHSVGGAGVGVVEPSTSSISSLSSVDAVAVSSGAGARPTNGASGAGAAIKRRRVVPMHPPPSSQHLHQPRPRYPHHPHLVQPQPQHFAHHPVLPHPMLHNPQHPHFAHHQPIAPHSSNRPPLSASPPPMSYSDFASAPLRAVSGSPYHLSGSSQALPSYYAYHSVSFASPPPCAMYPVGASPSPTLSFPTTAAPPPPPPTPAPGAGPVLRAGTPTTSSSSLPHNVLPAKRRASSTQVSSQRECEAVAEALLCLRSNSKWA